MKNEIAKTEPKSSIVSMSGLIRTDLPDMAWENGIEKKKLIDSKDLHDALGLNPINFARNRQTWLMKGIEGCDFNFYTTDAERPKVKGRVARLCALRIEFAKKICMMATGEEAKQVRDYLIRETRAAHELARRAAIAQPALPPAQNLSPAILSIINTAVIAAINQAKTEWDNDNRKKTEYTRLALADMRVDATDIKNKNDLRAEIVKAVNRICYYKNLEHKKVWDIIYQSFYKQCGQCSWIYEWSQAKNRLDFLMDKDIKFFRRLYNIVQAWI